VTGSVVTQSVAVRIPAGEFLLGADLSIPKPAHGMIVFAHGSGSSRHSSRNRFVAAQLQSAGLATLLMDLLTESEETADSISGHLRFDIPFLAQRLMAATDWVSGQHATRGLPVGYFGASTGGGAALVAAAAHPRRVAAVVSRGGRPDLAGDALPRVRTPTLLIVGGRDPVVRQLNEEALQRLDAEARLEIVPGATHLFEEPGALETVARLAQEWFMQHLAA
jgi:pimeloyl-ACP methyl ester carboxylesterase